MAGSSHDNESVREEFLSEAQEIVETLSRDLLLLEQGQKDGRSDPNLLNDIFRAVHTLKGLAGMFGMGPLSHLANTLENLLDDLRLGRANIDQRTLDILFDGVERIQRILVNDSEESDVPMGGVAPDEEQVAELEADSPVHERDAIREFELSESVLSVLTEYEEHRLRQNVLQGFQLYRLKVSFALSSIDTALEDLKSRARSVAELITYLPSLGGGTDDLIELEVLLASRADEALLRENLCQADAVLEVVPRRAVERRPTLLPQELFEAAEEAPAAVLSHSAPPAGLDRSGADALSLRSVANTVRVNIQKLDHLMNVVGELAIVRGAVAQITEKLRERPELRSMSAELHRIARGFERNLTELQDGILDVRMVPLGQVFDKLARVVRQAARDAKKEIRLEVKGAETEVDKLIVEELSDPLMHLIRNAIDHGIESKERRKKLGKPVHGLLSLIAYQKGNHVLIEVRDDGAGMDPDKLIARGVQRGMFTAEEGREMSREDAFNLIFAPGFSTREEVTDLSGRGVGMDVVKTNISKLGGVVDLRSTIDKGTTFIITLPITLAIISALVVKVCGQTYAIPLSNVHEALLLDPKAIRTVEGREVMTLRGGTLPLCRLKDLFRIDENTPPGRPGRKFVVVSQLGSRRIGMVVDLLLGQQDIVIKALGASLSGVRGFAGATDLGDQAVTLVIDTPQILEEVLTSASDRLRSQEVYS